MELCGLEIGDLGAIVEVVLKPPCARRSAPGCDRDTEIAQTRFVTRKTVEKHLGNAYAKLDVKSRHELARYFCG
jgi:hypothetical protein